MVANARVKAKAASIGEVDHKWLMQNKKFYLDQVVSKYKYNFGVRR